jgi:hypothetical protein
MHLDRDRRQLVKEGAAHTARNHEADRQPEIHCRVSLLFVGSVASVLSAAMAT